MLNLMDILKVPAKTGKDEESQGLRKRAQEIPRDLIILFVAFLVMCTVFAILRPQFLHERNIINVMRQVAVVFILASGQTFSILSAGIDLSQGAIVSLVSVVTGRYHHETRCLWGMAGGFGAGTFAGLITGLFVGVAGVQPFIATLGMIFIASGGVWSTREGSPSLGWIDPNSRIFSSSAAATSARFPFPVIVGVMALIVTHYLMYRTPFGRHVYAIGGTRKPPSCRGVNAGRVKILIYTLSGLSATVGSILLTSAGFFPGNPTSEGSAS